MAFEVSNVPERVNLKAKKGATFEFTADFKDSGGAPINLTGETVRLRVKKTHSSTTTLLVLDNGGSGGITLENKDGTNDRARVIASDAQTAGIETGCWVYDFERTKNAGANTVPIMSGGFDAVAEA